MTTITQMDYVIHDFHNSNSPKITTSISMKVHVASKYFLHRSLVIQDENRRQGNASCKTRSEVRGGGRKPWKQKGTGRARSGSSSSPLWNGGGVIFGPKPRVYRKKINSKEKRLALATALYKLSNRITILKNFNFDLEKPNTKEFLNTMCRLDSEFLAKKTLIVLSKIEENTVLSSRNLSLVTLFSASNLNLRALLKADHIFISEDALLKLTSI
nr:ribosomal protein L4 [Cryptomonas sp. NIES-345]